MKSGTSQSLPVSAQQFRKPHLGAFRLKTKTIAAICRFLGLSLVFSLPAFAAEPEWVSLFNGKDLDGWERHSGTAEYRVEDGVIVGKTVAKSPNTFLCTSREYGDFVLDFEFKVAAAMNSGVQFRSQFFPNASELKVKGTKKTIPADRVHGYQYEIDPSPRAYTGGIYDEGRRGWLFDLKNNEAARKAFKPGEWNQARIECQGDHLQTWINGVEASDLKDGMTLKGIIALQVHGIGKSKKAPGEEVRWRNLRIKELSSINPTN